MDLRRRFLPPWSAAGSTPSPTGGAATRALRPGIASLLLALPACAPHDGALDTASPDPAPFRVVTFNTGTSEGLVGEGMENGGYGTEQAGLSDTWYGDGLAWSAIVEDTAAFLADVAPVVVTFQEIFYTGDCADIPEEARAGFVCEGWVEADPTVAQRVLGDGWQVMCHPGKPDKCAAVRKDFGTFAGCDDDFCLEGMEGAETEGCGSGVRTGRATLLRADGSTLNLVSVHGSSGMGREEQDCRVRQFTQAFETLVDPAPAAANLVMGDFNTDPGRLADYDPSAAYLVGQGQAGGRFHFATEVGSDVEPTYQGLLNIDHVLADAFTGDCAAAGFEGLPAVTDLVFFDHTAIVCDLR